MTIFANIFAELTVFRSTSSGGITKEHENSIKSSQKTHERAHKKQHGKQQKD
jgi:hypothetical protein